jgi:hypothetical protein
MSENLKFWITLSVGFIGACAWAPFIYEKFQINHFDGKVISVYNNFNKDKSKIFFLFKISVVSRNKDFFLKDIDVKVKFPSSNYITSPSKNMRLVVFNFDSNFKKLNIPDNQLLNNLSVLKKDDPEVGYIFTEIPFDKDEPFQNLEFIFSSYDNNSKSISFTIEQLKSEKLLFDDSIWTTINITDQNLKGVLHEKEK